MSARRVGVVGGGIMGAGIASECLRAGLDVHVLGSGPASADRARTRVLRLLDRALVKGHIDERARTDAEARAGFGCDTDELTDRQFVIEAISEDREAKLRLFTVLAKTVEDPAAVLASTTSSLSIADLGNATSRPGDVIGLHFFNPVPAMPLVEVIRSRHTSDRTARDAEDFVTDVLGKQTVRAEDSCGFVVNALLIPYLLSAVRMYEAGVATPRTSTAAWPSAAATPWAPRRARPHRPRHHRRRRPHHGTPHRRPHHAVPPLLDRLIEEGRLGRKSGRGFHRYDTPATR